MLIANNERGCYIANNLAGAHSAGGTGRDEHQLHGAMKFAAKLDANKYSDWPYVDYRGLKS